LAPLFFDAGFWFLALDLLASLGTLWRFQLPHRQLYAGRALKGALGVVELTWVTVTGLALSMVHSIECVFSTAYAIRDSTEIWWWGALLVLMGSRLLAPWIRRRFLSAVAPVHGPGLLFLAWFATLSAVGGALVAIDVSLVFVPSLQ
jgi:hypothetical protein